MSARTSSTTARRTIGLFGNFGRGNLGNECTLQAMLHHVRHCLPDAELRCICRGPDETASKHQIAASPVREMPIRIQPRPNRPVLRFLRRLAIGVPTEVYRCAKAVWILRRTDMLVMTGTGMLGDFGILPFDLHYDILRWSIIAKLCGCKLLFVSVGAGPIDRPLSRRFVKWALALGDYRSYRDVFSKRYMESIGFRTNGDVVYPDLAFSLPHALIPQPSRQNGSRPVVGVGLMAYSDRQQTADSSDGVHREYIAKLATFVTWLLEHEYTVRLLIGDVLYDRRVKRDLKEALDTRRVTYDARRLIDDPVASPEDMLTQLASSDIVVASRFHNLLMALMLDKPVVAISYHEKVDSLMGALGLGEYCQDIDRLDIATLIGQLTSLERNADEVRTRVRKATAAYRTALDEQYQRIFGVAGARI